MQFERLAKPLVIRIPADLTKQAQENIAMLVAMFIRWAELYWSEILCFQRES